MTGIFTYRNFSIWDNPSLDGKVAVITGGQSGIGKEITAQLLLHGIAKAIILARSAEKFRSAQKEWKQRDKSLGDSEHESRVEFVQCDLGDVADVHAATEQIKQKTDKVDILICNAGLGVPYEYKRSAQNIDRIFATNCIGHFVLVTRLLPLLRNAASSTSSKSGSRVVFTSSSLHMLCRHMDFELLSSPSRVKWPVLLDGMWRYGRSQLGNILLAKEFSRRLQDESEDSHPASGNIYVNSYFPGNIVTGQWDHWSSYFGSLIGSCMRFVGRLCGQTVQDGAATAIYLATNDQVRERNLRGRYFLPVAIPGHPSPMAQDPDLGFRLWGWIEARVAKTLGSKI